MQARSLRVVVADGSYLVRQALERILEGAEDIDVVASCGDGAALRRAVERTRPDVVVTDIPMSPAGTQEGVQMTVGLRREHPHVGVVLLSEVAEPAYGIALLETGVDGCAYLIKEHVDSSGQLIGAIDTVARGGSLIDARVVDELAVRRARAADSPLNELTPRETEVLGYIARGLSNQAIADELVLTKRAVEKHINAVYLKLGLTEARDVSCRVKATLIYLADGTGDARTEYGALQTAAIAHARRTTCRSSCGPSCSRVCAT